MIWASPPCAEYSRALTRRPRRLEEGDRTAIRDLRPRFWCIENPQTGLLKRRPFMTNLQWSDVTYCKYGYPCKKATRLWRNLPCEPEHGPCCARSRCALSRANGGRHPSAAQRGTFRRRGEVVQNCQSQGQLYSIRGAVQGDRFGCQRSRGDSPSLVLGFLGFSKASTLACSFCRRPSRRKASSGPLSLSVSGPGPKKLGRLICGKGLPW